MGPAKALRSIGPSDTGRIGSHSSMKPNRYPGALTAASPLAFEFNNLGLYAKLRISPYLALRGTASVLLYNCLQVSQVK